MTTDKNKTDKIIFDAYHEKDIGKYKPLLFRIGAMWPHKNGKGFTADTVHGRMVFFLREEREKIEIQSEEPEEN